MSNKALAILAVIALIVVELSGLTWFFNQKISIQNANMAANQNNASANHDTQLPGNSDTSGGNAVKINHEYAWNVVKPREGQPIKKFTLTAQESNLKLRDGTTQTVWTYNGTVPGPEIRVTEGDFVQVELKNDLKVPVTIHWHGYPLASAMDGIPGITQDAVRPGETFVYQFSADVSGTYWYHSHQKSSEQVDKGLYGALIVEPEDKPQIDKDFTLILDEWMSDPKGMEAMEGMGESSGDEAMDTMDETAETSGHDGMDMSSSESSAGGHEGMDMTSDESDSGGHEGMDMSGDSGMSEEEMMAFLYDIYTVNGKSENLIKPIEVKKGDVVRLRFINAGYRSHGIHIPGQDFRVVSTDGQDIHGAGIIKDQIINIAPGERYDIEFIVALDKNFVIDAHDDNAYNDQFQIPVKVVDGSGKKRTESYTAEYANFDLFSYGSPETGAFSPDTAYTVEYNVELNTRMDEKTQKYTINGKTFNELTPLQLKTGDTVKLTFENKSEVDHPMHLHGHFFQVLSKNGSPVTGANLMKDTLLVKPGETYTVAFKADNPGKWVQHCHELHHAAAGMMMEIDYIDYTPNYVPDPNNTFNNAE